MTRKETAKPFWDMTKDELQEATKEWDEEFAAGHARPMTAEMSARWERAKSKLPQA